MKWEAWPIVIICGGSALAYLMTAEHPDHQRHGTLGGTITNLLIVALAIRLGVK